MGSIVAGAYAVGRSPEDIEKMVVATNWDEIFRDNPPRKEIATRRKMDDYKTLFAPEFGVKNGSLALPKGIIAGVSIEAFLRVVAEPATGINDFDKLPIPYRAVATDIETGEAVVLSHGNVAEAMRASMSVPGAIAPVSKDGRLLVDGMIANNLPIDQARKLCGDVVIAVNIGTPPLKRDEITSALAVVSQMMAFLGKQTVDEQLKSMGPERRADRARPRRHFGGQVRPRQATRSASARRPRGRWRRRCRATASRPSSTRRFAQSGSWERVALGTVDEIRFEGLKRTNPEVLRALVETKPGEPLDQEKIGADLRRIYGRGDFESVDARVVGSAGGPRAMVITPREKDWGPDYLRFGLGLESDFQGDNAFNLLFQYRKTWLNQLGARVAVRGADRAGHASVQRVLPAVERAGRVVRVAVRPGRADDTRRLQRRRQDRRISDQQRARGASTSAMTLGTLGIFRVGPQWTEVHARVDTGDPVLPSVRELTAGVSRRTSTWTRSITPGLPRTATTRSSHTTARRRTWVRRSTTSASKPGVNTRCRGERTP